MSDLEVVTAFAAALLGLLAVLLLARRRARRRAAPARAPRLEPAQARDILVDGSNVMHWGGDPSDLVLARVVSRLVAEGFRPLVCFDANAGYKLRGRYMNAHDLAPLVGISAAQVIVVDKGVAADEVLLQEARARRITVVTNDRFRDWSVAHPWVRNHKRFRRGTWRDGAVVWT